MVIPINKGEVNEIIKNRLYEYLDIDSQIENLEYKGKLNSNVWRSGKLIKNVKKHIVEIAKDFYKFIDHENLKVIDITITGSLANYNWYKESDLDIHLIMDFSEYSPKEKKILKELLNEKRKIYNERHDISIKGHEVEVYPQDKFEKHFSSGVYSLYKDDWKIKPRHTYKADFDSTKLKNRARKFIDMIDEAIKDNDKERLIELKNRISNIRQESLKNEGEYSLGNLVFKILRRSGYIDKLMTSITNIEDVELSLEELNASFR